MRFLVPLFVFLAVAAFHSALSAFVESSEEEEVITRHALSAFVESSEEEEVITRHDGLTELQTTGQMEFQAAQKNERVHMNIMEEQNEDTRYLEADKNGSAEGGGTSEVAAHEEHYEAGTETVSSSDEVSRDLTKEQDVLE